ncbi:MAG: chorismate-binding protein, partial [Verrucomicrobiales bacterium]
LSDPKPWKVPANFERLSRENFPFAEGDQPEVEWEALEREPFASVFGDIKRGISEGRIKKSVPVLTECGRVRTGRVVDLASRIAGLSAPLMGYGYGDEDCGFMGATPERLFSLVADRLDTMALAGTSPIEGRGNFVNDAKEIEEHELVAQYLIQHLADLGSVWREERECMELGPIVHFLTRIGVDLERPRTVDGLIGRMHPTPALGSFPRTMESLQKLHEYRAQLRAPKMFGAPFGSFFEGEFHSVVAIRNLSWDGDRVFLPSGCGVIEESTLENEWRELELKRRSVKEVFEL